MQPIRFAKSLIKESALYRHLFVLMYCKAKLFPSGTYRSYAEYGEDRLVKHLIGTVSFFIDVGAADGYHSSNTFYWALRRARGVCFEPEPESYAKLKNLYLLSKNVVCRNIGLSDESKDTDLVVLGALSYLPSTQDENHRALHSEWHTKNKELHRVTLRSFAEAIKGIDVPKTVDLLSIDVEGHELSVLRSVPFGEYSFRVIILETHHRNEKNEFIWKHRDLESIETLLAKYGYRSAHRTPSNTLYLPSHPLRVNEHVA